MSSMRRKVLTISEVIDRLINVGLVTREEIEKTLKPIKLTK